MYQYEKPVIASLTQKEIFEKAKVFLKTSSCVWKYTCPEMYEHNGTTCVTNYTTCVFVYGGQ